MARWGVHPLSTALFILGYALLLPIAFKMSTVVERQNRLALYGHQVGVLIVILGWAFRGAVFVAIGHAIWLVLVHLWFAHLGPGRKAAAKAVTTMRQSRSRRSTRRGGSTG